jgi:predicted DNA-binding protein
MKRISIFISERQYDRFQEFAQSFGQPAAELMRQALNEFIAKMDADTSSGVKADRKRVTARKRP